MRLVLHYFKKDVRRSRLLLLFWLALIALEYGLTVYGLRPGDHGGRVATTMAVTMVMPLRILLSAILIGLVIHEEAPTGTTAFWLTRPVRRSTVLATKLITLALVVVVPAFAELVVLRLGGFVAHDLKLAAVEILLDELQIVFWAAAVAALTPNFARYAIMGLGLFIVGCVFEFGGDWIQSFFGSDNARAAKLWASISILRSVVTIAGLGIVLAFQFLTRRSRWSLAGVVATMAIAAVVGWIWKWDFVGARVANEPLAKIEPAGFRIKLRETDARDDPDYGLRQRVPQKEITAAFDVQGLSQGRLIIPTHVSTRFVTRSGEALATSGPGQSHWIDSPNSSAIASALGHVFVYGMTWERSMVHSGLARFDPTEFRRHSQESITFSAMVDFEVDRFVVTGRVPLARGSSIRHGSEQTYITEVLRNGHGLDLMVEHREPKLLLAPSADQRWYGRYLSNPALSIENHLYVLANVKTGEVVRTRQMGSGATRVGGYQDGQSQLIQQMWELSFGPENYAPIPDLDDDWLANAQLVELSLEPIGVVTQALNVEHFTLEGPNKALAAPEEVSAVDTDPEWLTRFELPEHPTKSEARKYVSRITAALPYWHSRAHADLPIDMLAKIGPGNADVLIDALTKDAENYVTQNAVIPALARTAGPDDKAAILRALPAYPSLADLVVKFHWEADCRAELLRALQDGKRLPRTWIVAVASLHDPSTYPALKAYLVSTAPRRPTYDIISKLPGIDLDRTIVEAWQKASAGSRNDRIDAAQFAAEVGVLPALGVLIDELRNREVADPAHIQRIEKVVRRITPANGDADAVVQWYDANKDHLVYDASSRKFVPTRESKS